jgi:hypothetical protein
MIGTDEPAIDIGLALILNGVSKLRLYDPAPVVDHQLVRSSPHKYRAIALAHRLANVRATPQTEITGYPFRFGLVEASFPCNLGIVINADHQQRIDCDDFFQAKTPYLAVTYSPEKGEGSVVVHQGHPCLAGLTTDGCPSNHGMTQVYHLIKNVRTHLISLVAEAADSIVQGYKLSWDIAHVWSPVNC